MKQRGDLIDGQGAARIAEIDPAGKAGVEE